MSRGFGGGGNFRGGHGGFRGGGGGGGFHGGSGGGFQGGRGGGDRGGFGGRGGGRGGRGGFGGGFRSGFDQGPPEEVIEFACLSHPCQDDLVAKVTDERVPFFNAPRWAPDEGPSPSLRGSASRYQHDRGPVAQRTKTVLIYDRT
nr:probable H/ACA ribonucleoprotein complex subunit 1-like protein [Dermacentor andersoni]XP_050029051.2 probable H/ACA ribonucleoprotein complex subunit 1-like protein [Dermacentor andersoni]